MNSTQRTITEAHNNGTCQNGGTSCTCSTRYAEAGKGTHATRKPYTARVAHLDNTARVETLYVEVEGGRNQAAGRAADSIASLHNDNPDADAWYALSTDEGATIYGRGARPVALVTAKEA